MPPDAICAQMPRGNDHLSLILREKGQEIPSTWMPIQMFQNNIRQGSIKM